ncbi:MAG: amino acid permease, partial [Haloarculaceae archaeon]
MIAGALYALGFAPNFLELLHVYGVVPPPDQVGALAVPVLPVDLPAGFALLPAMGLTFIAFEGYDLITTVTEEVENPRENIPKAIFVSLAATVIVYMLVVTVAIGTLGAEGLAEAGEAGIARAATEFMPTDLPVIQNGGAVIVFGAVFSTLTALNAVVIASSRVAFSMGREGKLLPGFGQIHHRFRTPFLAILASAVVMLGSVVLPTESAGNMSSLFFLLSFVVVNGAVIKLRRERPDMNRPYEMPYYPVPPVLGILLNLLLTGVLVRYLIRTDPLALALSAGWILLGVVAYLGLNLAVCMAAKELSPGIRTVARIERAAGKGYTRFVDAVVFPERAGARVAANEILGSDVRTLADVTGTLDIMQIRVE